MTTKYIVVESVWDYNDEYYSSTEGYIICKLYSNKEKAEEFALKSTLKFVKSCDLAEFGYDRNLYDICYDSDKFIDLVKLHDPKNSCIESDGELNLDHAFEWPDHLPEEIQLAMAKCFGTTFFDVVEIEES